MATDQAKTHEEHAATILDSIGSSVSTGSGADNVAGAIIAVGHALLAIHTQLVGLRNEISATRTVLRR